MAGRARDVPIAVATGQRQAAAIWSLLSTARGSLLGGLVESGLSPFFRAFPSSPTGLPHWGRELLRLLPPALRGVGGLGVQGAGWRSPGVPSELGLIREEPWPIWHHFWASIPALLQTACVTLGRTPPCSRLSLLSVTRGGWSGGDL